MSFKVGLIGCGCIGHFHASQYRDIGKDRVEMVACCDINADRAKKFAEDYNIPNWYASKEEMLAAHKFDGVSVCTWNSAHKECTIAALEAGANVICEKPMAMNTAEGLEMKAAAEKAGKLLMIGFVRRHGADAATALDFINKGYLGEVYYVKTNYIRRAGFPGHWFGDKRFSGGGPLIDLGVHMIDLSRFLLGNPKPVTVFGVTFDKLKNRPGLKSVVLPWAPSEPAKNEEEYEFSVEDLVSAMVKFDNGAVLQVEASFSLNTDKEPCNVELFGDKAGLTLNPFTIHGVYNDFLADINVHANTGAGNMFRSEIENFLNAIEGTAPCLAPADDGVELMRILDAIYESAATGKSVDIVR
jgi:predicted dehydrogenase